MTITELISQVDRVRPNQYDNEQKTRWISEIEGTIVEEILNMAAGNDIEFSHYSYENDAETTLLIPERFSDVYLHYLLAKIDFHDSETESYNNDVIMYQASYNQFAAWYRRRNMPKQSGYFRGF